MTPPRHRIDRRQALLGASALALSALPALPADGRERDWREVEALREAIGDAEVTEGGIALELPEVAENGNSVPLTVSVDSPMTDADHVRSIHIFALENPRPRVARFHFTPASGKAAVITRIRLSGSQDVIAVARLSGGGARMVARPVRVTVGGCGS